MSFNIAALKKELAALASAPLAISEPKSHKESKKSRESKSHKKPKAPKEVSEKARNGGKFDEWNAFVLATQKDMARLAGLPPYESYQSHAAFIKAAGEKGCGRIAAMQEASRRREEATGELSFVKKRAAAAAAYIEEHPHIEEGEELTYIQRLRNRLREQTSLHTIDECEEESSRPTSPLSVSEDPLKVAGLSAPWIWKLVSGSPYFINGTTGEAFYIEEGNIGERAGVYDKETDIIDTTY